MGPYLTIPDLEAAYAAGATPTDVVDGIYDRLAGIDDPGIFVTLVDREKAHAAARALSSQERHARPLWGIPFVVKDNIDVAGYPTTAACPAFAYHPAKTAFAVQRLIDAGAILIGKTNLDQFATGLVGVRTPFPVPRNACDPDLVPGGSSSGSAVAVAHGLVPIALGTDTAGSGRIPAALNNIVGMKPSLGLVSTAGVVPACRTLDCVSVFALTVADAWRAMSVLISHDADEPYARCAAPPVLRRPTTLRIGVPTAGTREFSGDIDAEAAFEAAVATVQAKDAVVVPIDLTPFLHVAKLLYDGPWVAERYQAIRAFIETASERMHPVTRAVIEQARQHSAADAFSGIYRLAELKRLTAPVWREIDLMLVPSMPTVCTRADVARDPVGANARLGTYTNFVNLLDLCALAVPTPVRRDGRPAGITLIAPREQDGLLASVGSALQDVWRLPVGATGEIRTERLSPQSAPETDRIELVVVGAHMTGLPLNHQLTERGARFLRTASTTSGYRLFALPGGPPERPGLLRVTDGTGCSIAVEVWTLDATAFGDFVSIIPAPLGIATLEMSDGTSAKGFVVESAGIDGARDISAFGGWRNFLARDRR